MKNWVAEGIASDVNDFNPHGRTYLTHDACLKTMREHCEEEMWVWLFPHHKCQKILSNHESKTSDLTSFWHEWCGKTNTHISDLTVFTLLKTTITQIWQFFWKNCQIVVKCVHEFYCHFVKCVHWSLFNSFFTIVVFNNVHCWKLL